MLAKISGIKVFILELFTYFSFDKYRLFLSILLDKKQFIRLVNKKDCKLYCNITEK